MKLKYHLVPLLIIALTFASCDSKGPKRPPEASIVFGILDEDNPWMTTEIVQDSVPYLLLNNTIMVDLEDENITVPEQIYFLFENSPPEGKLNRNLLIKSALDEEYFVADVNVFVPYSSGPSMRMINEIPHYFARIGMLIPIKIGAKPIIGNDTLELSTPKDFVEATYHSPVTELSVTEKITFWR